MVMQNRQSVAVSNCYNLAGDSGMGSGSGAKQNDQMRGGSHLVSRKPDLEQPQHEADVIEQPGIGLSDDIDAVEEQITNQGELKN